MKPNNYAAFYGLLNRMYAPDKEELKKSIVSQYTCGRTESLSAVTASEYTAMIRGMREAAGQVAPDASALRRKRSVALREMQLYGVDTTDWNRVNAFCKDARIAGKAFYGLSSKELDAVAVKLRVIQRKAAVANVPEKEGTGCKFILLSNI
jgi:hypothetical protein